MDIPLLTQKPALALILVSCWLAPGLIALGLYDPALLLNLDLVRLLVFALVIPAPCLMANIGGFIITMYRRDQQEDKERDAQDRVAEATAAGFISHTAIFYSIAFTAWVNGGHRTAFVFLWVGCSLAAALATAVKGLPRCPKI